MGKVETGKQSRLGSMEKLEDQSGESSLRTGGIENLFHMLATENMWEKDKNKKVLRKARKAFEKKLYKEVKKNPKALYRYINAKKGNRTPITKLRQRNGMNTSNDREAAEELNEFFQSVFVKEED